MKTGWAGSSGDRVSSFIDLSRGVTVQREKAGGPRISRFLLRSARRFGAMHRGQDLALHARRCLARRITLRRRRAPIPYRKPNAGADAP